jgi:alcohol dehydrogenase
MVKNFEFNLPVRIVFGIGSLGIVGQECSKLGTEKVMLVVDKNLVNTAAFAEVVDSLSKLNIKAAPFSDFTPDPDEQCIDRGLAELRKQSCEVLIGFGGGSAIDTAKAIALSATIPAPMKEYEGINKLSAPVLPVITIPTTAGTGSEVSSATIITSKVEKRKYMIKSPFIFPKVAILDPTVLTTLPKSVAASAGIDAVVHALESYISRRSSPMSEMFATTSLTLAARNLRDFAADRGNLEAGANMLLASMLAAVAMAQTGLGVVHALSHPLGARFHIPHGLACALVLCDCIEAMTGAAIEKFAMVAKIMDPEARYATGTDYAKHLVGVFRKLLADLEVETGLGKFGVTEGDINIVVADSIKSGIAAFSPKEFSAEDMAEILRRAL